MLIFLMMMSLQGFSQKDTVKTIQLKRPIAKLVIKDLITGDGAREEIKLLGTKLFLIETKLVFKDSIILNLNKSVMNFENILYTKEGQLDVAQELSLRLQKDLKKQKVKTKIFQWGSGTLIVGAIVLSLLK
jgi:hypothetical protein